LFGCSVASLRAGVDDNSFSNLPQLVDFGLGTLDPIRSHNKKKFEEYITRPEPHNFLWSRSGNGSKLDAHNINRFLKNVTGSKTFYPKNNFDNNFNSLKNLKKL
jgi:hypothetical protein